MRCAMSATGSARCGGSTFRKGCGSFEVSWLRCEDMAVAVFRVVDAFVLAAEVEAPVVLEVAAGDEGAELQDGLGAFEAPSRARYVHSVLDDVPAGALDDPGGDGPALRQRGGVVQVVLLVLQVAGAFVGAGALGRGVAVGGGAAADPGRDLAGLAVQDLAGLVSDPFLGGGLALVEEGPGGLPQVFEHVDEVDDDRDGDAAGRGLGGDGLDLGVVAVDQDDPFALVAGVAAFRLVEGAAMTAGMSSVTEAVSHLPCACGSRGFPFPSAWRPALSSSSASARGC